MRSSFFCLLMFAFPDSDPLFVEESIGSAYSMGFAAISVCILYTALCTGAVDGNELTRMARNSAVFIRLAAVFFLVDRAGIFPHHRRVENQRID